MLTPDLVKVEPEPSVSNSPDIAVITKKTILAKDVINVHISRDLKKRFQMWCFMREKTMTEAVEEALEKLVG